MRAIRSLSLAQRVAAIVGSATLFCATNACAGTYAGGDISWLDGVQRPSVGQGPIRLRWTEPLAEPGDGSYEPVEHAVPGLDPAHDRVYVGSTRGKFWAMRGNGQKIWLYNAEGGIEAAPAIDGDRGEVYVGTTQGFVHALRTGDGSPIWQKPIEGAVRNQPVLSEDAVYVTTNNDLVVAYSRESGEVLWRYHRDPPDGFSIAGHAGMVLADNKLLAAFSDGVLVALDPGDGHAIWERDTALDLEEAPEGMTRFIDIDTTPVVLGTSVYIASFAAGFYELALSSGSVRGRDSARTGITAITASQHALDTEGAEGALVLSSADDGVVCLGLPDRAPLWTHRVARGSASVPRIAGEYVYVGENNGGFLALSLPTGQEVSRFEAGYGFSAEASIADRRGFVLSNGGTLFAFSLAE